MYKTIKLTETKLRNMVRESIMNLMEYTYGRKEDYPSTPEEIEEKMHSINYPYFEIEDEVLGVDYDPNTNTLYAGGISNWGTFKDYTIDYDIDKSFDANIEDLYYKVENDIMSNKDYDSQEDDVVESIVRRIMRRL